MKQCAECHTVDRLLVINFELYSLAGSCFPSLVQVVSQEEVVASGEAAKVQAIKDECEADLAEAMPAMQAAVRALDTLTKNDITEVKGMKSPPAGAFI